jgi:hypothetical protein
MLVTTILAVTTAVLALFLFTIFLYHLQIKNKMLSVVELVTIEKLNTRDPEMTKDLLAKESCVWAHAQTLISWSSSIRISHIFIPEN